MGSGREVRERNTKSQTPSSREIPNFKFQNLSQDRCLGAWDLEFLWSLVFGVWSFNWRKGGTLDRLIERAVELLGRACLDDVFQTELSCADFPHPEFLDFARHSGRELSDEFDVARDFVVHNLS